MTDRALEGLPLAPDRRLAERRADIKSTHVDIRVEPSRLRAWEFFSSRAGESVSDRLRHAGDALCLEEATERQYQAVLDAVSHNPDLDDRALARLLGRME